MTTTAADVEGGDFSLTELVDLALCSPEVGAVNFNILRILLQEILGKLGMVDQKVTLGDLESHQINNFKSYIQGAGTASPMPGVLRYAPGKQMSDPVKTPRTGRQDQQPNVASQPTSSRTMPPTTAQPHGNQPLSSRTTPPTTAQAPGKSMGGVYARQSHLPLHPTSEMAHQDQARGFTPPQPTAAGGGAGGSSSSTQLEKKVARLERHLDALYALPTNSRLLGMGKHDDEEEKTDMNMSVNDMWQIIQLNNRIAAAEAAIQKMASLIEELASQIKHLKKGDRVTTGLRKEVENMARTSSEMAMNLEPCMEKCEQTAEAVTRLKQDLEKIKKHLLEEIKKLSLASGVDLTSVPSFMMPRKSVLDSNAGGARGSLINTPFTQLPLMPPSIIEAHAGSPGFTVTTRGTHRYSVDGVNEMEEQEIDILGLPLKVDENGQKISEVEWLDANGLPVEIEYDENGLPIIYGPDGKRIWTNDDIQYDADGQPLFYGPNGERLFGIERQYGPNGELLFGNERQYGPNGELLFGTERQYGPNGELLTGDQELRGEFDGDDTSASQRGRGSTEPGDDDLDGLGQHGQHPEEGNLSDAHPEARHQGISHVPVDVVSGIPLDQLQDKLDPFTDFQYPSILDDGTVIPGRTDPRYEEQCIDQADIVQKELQAQYTQLVEMQRQMADEIQDKMEMVYQKLLKEIAAQHATTSPYMAVGLNAEKCLGPGVCTGFGLPAGTAVVQFPQKPDKVEVCAKEGKVCPGRDVCPGKEVCPTCKDDILHHLRTPGERPKVITEEYPKSGLSSSKENLLRQMTSMTLLPRELEEFRDKLKDRGIIPDVFDEADVLEKLQTVWEVVKIIKNNEENMAVRLVQQDAIIKKIPPNALDKLGRMSEMSFDKLESDSRFGKGMKKNLTGDDIQLIFNNLSSLVLENASMKEKLQKINDVLLDIEQNFVTKPMLMNSLGDKADKGQMNTKVSYDEFGASMDEVQTRLGNLLQEVYHKNELWKEITDQMQEDLNEKLDKVEIGPLRAYFKNHLGKLEEKVGHLTQIMEEPDPAGTRKKLLKDYNCISCDRHTNISGITNAPLLPVLGPILAGHSTASQRAFELYRMRPQTSGFDAEARDYCKMERQRRGDANYPMGDSMPLNDSDVLHLVNRYVGGSHTSISNKARVASLHKRVSMVTGTNGKRCVPEVGRPKTAAAAPTSYYNNE